jgi:hypothetical protein
MLAELHPLVSAWVEDQERLILEQGAGLSAPELRIATRAGVLHPERVKLLAVAKTPLPEEKTLRRAAQAFGFVSEMTDGLTAGYGFFVRESRRHDPALVAHELAHVAQYERFGGIPAFVAQYLAEINENGYDAAPLELEAVAFAESQAWEQDDESQRTPDTPTSAA